MAAVVEGTLGTGTGPGDSPPLATPSATPIDISPASDSGTAGQLRLQTSWRAEAPRVAPKAIDVTDLQALLPFFQAHNEKLYFSGVVFKRRDLDSHGRKIALKDREDVWTSWWVELRGSVMQFWGAADEDLQKATAGPPSADLVAAIKEKQPVPNYINITDGCTTVVPDHGERHSQAISSPMSTITENSDAQTLTPASSTARSPTDVPPDARFAHRFHMTSAGCNLYTLGCPTVHMRDGWLFAIRLAQFEFARLCEAFTFRLLQRPAVSKSAWSDLGVDRTTMAPTNRAKPGEILQQGWLLARVTYETEWSRFWCVVTAGDDKLEATPRSTVDRRSADMASLAPSAVSGKSGDGKDTSSIFGRFLSAPKSPRPGHSDTFHVARIALYSDKKDLKKNRDPIIVIQGCYSAFALYPGRAELVMGPGVVKVEADNIRVRWDLLHPPASPGRRERRPFSTSPSAPFVLFMLPTVQDLARLVLSICGSASAPGHALLHANADMEDCAVDSEGSQLWLSVAELVAFLPFLRSLPTMAPKAELLALIAEKRRIIGQSNDSEQDWIQKVQKRWSEWLSSGLNADVGLRIPSFGKASDQMKRVKSGTSRSPRKPSSKVDEAVRRAYEIAMLMEAAANKNLSPKSPGAFSFSAGPDVLSTMNTPLAERAPTASYASATPLRLATPSAVAPAVQASLAPQPATSPQRLGTEAAEGGAEESEEDLPLALAVHKQTIVEEEVSEFVAPIKIAAGETQQSADQPEIPTEAAPSIVEDEQVAGEDSSSDGDEDPEDARSPVTIEQLIQQEYQAADDQTDSVPTEVAPIAVPMLTVTQQSSMVLVAVPSPTVQEDGQQVWDWEYQLVERDELNASIVEVSLAAAQEAVLASQPQPPVDKLIKLTVVTRNDAKPDAPDSAPSEADTVVPSGTIESTTEGRTDAPAGVPAVSEDLGGQGDDQGEDAADFHTPTNEEVAEEVANVVQVSKQADPVEQVAGVAMNPVTGNETDGEEDEKPLVHQTTSMSLK
ncbi:hypothetical protein DFJ74DRAFT_687773 [Hyaloraphidium curvatum]|nr:hypothetical protein DFJ74DRAFT_687773 [Hyaloraphidium curvatum]